MNPNAQALTATSVNVSWSRPTTPYGIITYYSISWYAMAAGANGTQNVTADVTSCIITGLVPCTTYNVVVQAATIGIGTPSLASATTQGTSTYIHTYIRDYMLCAYN
jgi:hypothetical protein